MESFQERVDPQIYIVSSCGPGCLILHHVHECDDNGTGGEELVPADNSIMVPVSLVPLIRGCRS